MSDLRSERGPKYSLNWRNNGHSEKGEKTLIKKNVPHANVDFLKSWLKRKDARMKIFERTKKNINQKITDAAIERTLGSIRSMHKTLTELCLTSDGICLAVGCLRELEPHNEAVAQLSLTARNLFALSDSLSEVELVSRKLLKTIEGVKHEAN